MARGEPAGPGSPLPAPYRSPWSDLREALAAVLADRRLALRRLWRRNREGDLPLPGIWPRNLAPLFWPLLLSAALALLLVVGGWLLKLTAGPRSTPAATGGDATAGPLTPAGPRQEQASATSPSRGEPPVVAGAPLEGQGPQVRRPGSGELTPQASTADADRLAPAMGETGTVAIGDDAGPQAPELRLDPLLELLSPGDDAELLLAARPDPASARLSLTLSDAAEALPQDALLKQAQRWQQRAHDAGYERLELRDRQGRLRGREALVGSGMILLAPVPGS